MPITHVRQWTKKSTGQLKKTPAFVRFPVLNTSPVRNVYTVLDFHYKNRLQNDAVRNKTVLMATFASVKLCLKCFLNAF